MESHRWMDLDDSWVYSTNPRRQPDNLLKYSTLPGRTPDHYRPAADIPRRSADERGKYGTIPGRYLNKGPMRGQSPYRLWSTTRLPQGAVLQDSTNWGSNMSPLHRASTLGRMDQNSDRKSDAHIREQFHYKWDSDLASVYATEYERKRQRLPANPYGEMILHSPSGKQRHRGKLIQMDSIYGKWEADYILEKKMKELKYDEWEPLHNLPKALQNQLLSQTNKVEYPETEKTKSAVTNARDTSQEKKSWWSKLVRSTKSGVTNPAISETSQEKADKMYVLQNSSNTKKQEVPKENRPQLRKRKVPPPYVPPPSYDYPHRVFPIKKEKANNAKGFGEKSPTQILPLHDIEDCQEIREKVPRYSVESTRAAKTNLTSSANIRQARLETDEKKKSDLAMLSMIQGRKLPRAHSTWTGPNSDEFIDHIYESVEGRSSPLTHNIPNFPKTKPDLDLQTDKMIYGTVSFPLQRDTSMPYTTYLSNKIIHDENEGSKRKNKTTEHSHRQMPPYDVRPPIPLHGVKLPRELGFSYASGDLQNVDRRIRDYININKHDSEQGQEWRRPLRVVSSKDSKSRSPSKSSTNRVDYGRYSHTLPLKKQYMKPYAQEETKHGDSRKQRIPYQDIEFPRWRESGNVNTLPGRSRDHNRWRYSDGIKISKKSNSTEHSHIRHRDVGRSQVKEITTEKLQPALSDDSEGLFVIDATCVVVRAEYIFPPVMEQVKFVPNEKSKGETLAVRDHSESPVHKERAPHLSPHSKPSSRLPQQPLSQKSHSKVQQCSPLSTGREASTLKERAVRILGLSIGELDNLNEGRDQHKPNGSLTEVVNTDQGRTSYKHEREVQTNRKESKIRNYKEMPCILEDVDSLPASSVTGNDGELISNRPMCDNGTEGVKGLGLEENVCIPDVQNTRNNCSESSNLSVQNDQILATPDPHESHPPAINCGILNPSPSVVADGMELDTSMNEETQEEVEAIVTAQNCEPLDIQPPEELKQGDGLLEEEECPVEQKTISMVNALNLSEENPIINTEEVHPTENQVKEKKCKPIKQVSDFINPRLREEPNIQRRQPSSNVSSDSQTDQTSSSKGLMKAYSRRPNYYAKDLREAVSRIRRHTAPDSDTDEDIEKPSFDSTGQVSDDCVTSCSSDTSDSEVTVILCESERDEDTLPITEDAGNEGMNGHSEDVLTEESVAAEPPPETLNERECVDQSSILPVPAQEAAYDLNSCIEEILQDLNMTEQEFFSSSDGPSEGSAGSGVEDLQAGSNRIDTGMDMESATTE